MSVGGALCVPPHPCSPRSLTGICQAEVEVPSSWFDEYTTVNVVIVGGDIREVLGPSINYFEVVGRGPTLDAHVGLGTTQRQVLFHCRNFAAQSDYRVQVLKAWLIME